MYEELGKIRLINKVKQKAIKSLRILSTDIYLIKQLLIQTEHTDLKIEEIVELWERTLPGGSAPTPPPPPPGDKVSYLLTRKV